MKMEIQSKLLECQSEKFSLEPGHHYLNCAYMSPLLRSVQDAGVEGIRSKNNPFQVKPDHFFDPPQKLKGLFSELLNIPDPDRVVIIPAVSYLISTVAKNIDMGMGDEILLVDEQFPSQVYPWLRKSDETGAKVITVYPPEGSEHRGQDWNERILESINANTKVVCLGNVHWADGTRFDLMEIRKRTWEVGARLIIDGTQSVGALPLDIQEIQPDALACAGYKFLLGPYSIGLGYLGEAFDQGTPIEENWINRYESEHFEKLVQYQERYKPMANRYGVGEHSNFILVPMMTKALEQIQEWGVASIQDYCTRITANAIDRLRGHGYKIEESRYRANHLFGIRLPDAMDLESVKKSLQDRNIYVSIRGSSIRVSPHLYNTEEEIELLADSLIF